MVQLKFIATGAISLEFNMAASVSNCLSRWVLQGKLPKLAVYSDNTGSNFVS